MSVSDSTINNNGENSSGTGGVNGFNINIARSVILNNESRLSGGGVRGRTVTITDSVVPGNYARLTGGGIFSWGDVFVDRSLIAGNTAGVDGGGVRAILMWINDSTISRNRALDPNGTGGGIRSGRVAYLRRMTVSGNVTEGDNGRGAGIWSHDRVVLAESTVTDNRATSSDGRGGGVWIEAPADGDDAINSSGSIIAGNIAAGGSADINAGMDGVELRHSLIGDNDGRGLAEAPVGSPDENGNLIGGAAGGVIDPLLGALADNGGFKLPNGSTILTHNLLLGSPAIDKGDPDFDLGDPDSDPATDDAAIAQATVERARSDHVATGPNDSGSAIPSSHASTTKMSRRNSFTPSGHRGRGDESSHRRFAQSAADEAFANDDAQSMRWGWHGDENNSLFRLH